MLIYPRGLVHRETAADVVVEVQTTRTELASSGPLLTSAIDFFSSSFCSSVIGRCVEGKESKGAYDSG